MREQKKISIDRWVFQKLVAVADHWPTIEEKYTEQPCPLIFGTMGMETIGGHEDFPNMDM
jgi:hypothetical protein